MSNRNFSAKRIWTSRPSEMARPLRGRKDLLTYLSKFFGGMHKLLHHTHPILHRVTSRRAEGATQAHDEQSVRDAQAGTVLPTQREQTYPEPCQDEDEGY